MKKMYVLGTGQAIVMHYHNTCFVLSDGENYFLIDGGGGSDILRCMDQMKISWERKLHYVFDTGGSGIMARARFSGKKGSFEPSP